MPIVFWNEPLNAHYFNQIDPNLAGSHLGADSHSRPLRCRIARPGRAWSTLGSRMALAWCGSGPWILRLCPSIVQQWGRLLRFAVGQASE
jgi:hypothetical protein